MDENKLRAWWSHRQGLDGAWQGKSAAEVLRRSGWARSVGGVGPYLSLFARAGISRAETDQAVAELAIHELPSARGCTYVLPAEDFALGLKVGQAFNAASIKVGLKLGVSEKEIDLLCQAVKKALAKGPLDPEAIRSATGKASRSLGDAGKKKGLSTTLPLALGRLQAEGEIRRVPVNGRVDQQRYHYALWRSNPLAHFKGGEDEAYEELARCFFSWVGPATLAEFQWFSGLGVKVSKDCVATLALAPMEPGSERLLLAEDLVAFRAFKVPAKAHYTLVSNLDALVMARRNLKTLIGAKDIERKVCLEKGTASLGSLSDLPNHAIFDRGRLVGLWEFDTESGRIVWASFGVEDKALLAAIERTEDFVRGELGDARSFSLDSPKSRVTKIEALRNFN